MKSYGTLIKDIFREIWISKSRFLSIFMIVAISVGFFVGVKSATPNMLNTADIYYKGCNLADIQIKSSLGLTEDDLSALHSVNGIKSIRYGYSADLFIKRDEGSNSIAKVISIDLESLNGDRDYINKFTLLEGRMPENDEECLIDKSSASNQHKLGSKITLAADTGDDIGDILRIGEFTVVGYVSSPEFVSFDKGKASIGNGKVSSFMFVAADAFAYDVYTDIYITFKATDVVSFESDMYEEYIDGVVKEIEKIAEVRGPKRYEEVVADANEKIDDAQEKIDDARKEYRDGKKKFDSEISKAEKKLDSARTELDELKKTVSSLPGIYPAALKEYNSGLSDYLFYENLLNEKQKELDDAEDLLNEVKNINSLSKAAAEALARSKEDGVVAEPEEVSVLIDSRDLLITLFGTDFDLSGALDVYLNTKDETALLSSLDMIASYTENYISVAEPSISEGKGQLEIQRTELEGQKSSLDSAKEQIDKMKYLLENGDKLIGDGQKALKEGQSSLKKEKSRGEKVLKEAEIKISDAQKELDDAKEEIADIKMTEWYIFERKDNPGYKSFMDDVSKVDKVAAVFPVFFILVAGLVCSTTMGRMVEEQRMQIGSLKSLGYSNFSISVKYLSYAFIAGLTGSIFGIAVGFNIIPRVIFNAYKSVYIYPDLKILIPWDSMVLSAAAALSVVGISAYMSCQRELKSTPATLLRPKSPKAGKVILLEKIGFIWNRLDFLHKVTIRNLFRYKKRVAMTVIGITGCTALLLAGYGLRYSIGSIVDKQFKEIFVYDLMGVFDDKIDAPAMSNLRETLDENESMSGYMFTRQESVSVQNEDGSKTEVYLQVFDDPLKIRDYVVLQTRKDKQAISLSGDGAVITEKLSKLLGVEIGDPIDIYVSENDTASITVTGVVENYAMHYVYVTPRGYEKINGHLPIYNTFVANLEDGFDKDNVGVTLLKNKDMLMLSFTQDSGKTVNDLVDSLSYVVLVIIISAGLLAFVVMYNLANINITERTREIATIKVLGFNAKEVSSYITRENTASSFMGICLGLLAGVPLKTFIVTTAEDDAVMFAPGINVESFLYAIAFTILFTLVVNFILHIKLKKIDMAQSLKSID